MRVKAKNKIMYSNFLQQASPRLNQTASSDDSLGKQGAFDHAFLFIVLTLLQ
jgi:hypothetical protein